MRKVIVTILIIIAISFMIACHLYYVDTTYNNRRLLAELEAEQQKPPEVITEYVEVPVGVIKEVLVEVPVEVIKEVTVNNTIIKEVVIYPQIPATFQDFKDWYDGVSLTLLSGDCDDEVEAYMEAAGACGISVGLAYVTPSGFYNQWKVLPASRTAHLALLVMTKTEIWFVQPKNSMYAYKEKFLTKRD
jgi:hypothetical protein